MKKSYLDWCNEYPIHIVIRKEGFFYSIRYEAAFIVANLMNWNVGYSFGECPITGSPVLDPIIFILEKYDYNFIVIENNEIIHSNNTSSTNTNCIYETSLKNNINNKITLKRQSFSNEELLDFTITLLQGIDPLTGEILNNDDTLKSDEMLAILSLMQKQLIGKIKKDENAPKNHGAKWTVAEDQALKERYLNKIKISEIAMLHERTSGSIKSRILTLFPEMNLEDKKLN